VTLTRFAEFGVGLREDASVSGAGRLREGSVTGRIAPLHQKGDCFLLLFKGRRSSQARLGSLDGGVNLELHAKARRQ
jgi:hypothetical protein